MCLCLCVQMMRACVCDCQSSSGVVMYLTQCALDHNECQKIKILTVLSPINEPKTLG